MKMKKWLKTVSALLLISAFTATANAQKNNIKFHPISGKLAYERMFTEKLSGQVAIGILPIFLNVNDGEDRFGFVNYVISPELRFYFGKDREMKPAGFYIAPYLRGGITEVKATVTSETDLTERVRFRGNTIGGGALLGWQWVTDSGFNIGTALGWGFSRFNFDDITVNYSDGTQEKEEFRGLNFAYGLPQFRFSLGYAF